MNQQPNQPQYPHAAYRPQPHQGRPSQPSNGLGIASFVTALVSLVLCCGFLSPISLLLGFFGLFKAPRGFAFAGVVLSLVGLLPVVFLTAGLLTAGSAIASIGLGELWAHGQAGFIDSSIQAYIQQNNTVPASLSSLPGLSSAAMNDPWGNPFVYTPDPVGNTYTLSSLGPDGMPGTADDIDLHP